MLARLDELRPSGTYRPAFQRSLLAGSRRDDEVATRTEALGILTRLARHAESPAAIALERALRNEGAGADDELERIWRGARPPITSPRGLRRHVARTGPAKLPEQNEETVLVVWRQIRPAPPGLQRQVTNLAALIGRESIPVLPTLRVQPQDRGEDSAPWDFPHGSDRLQDPRWHRCHPGYPAPGTSNGDGFPPSANERTRPRCAREMCVLEIADGSDDGALPRAWRGPSRPKRLMCLGLKRARPACLPLA